MTTLTVLPLLQTLREFARDPDLLHLHDPAATERQWTELITTDDLQIWLISWHTGAETGWHDHGTAGGAFATIAGRLTENSWDGAEHIRSIGTGDAWSFAPGHIPKFCNMVDVQSISVHAYCPRLTKRTRYQLRHSRTQER